MSLLTTAVLALAENPPTDIDPTTGKGAEWGKAAPIGLLVILLMGIAVFFLLRSMNRNMRKVPASFDAVDETDRVEPEAPGQPDEHDDEMSPAAADADGRAPADAAGQEPVDRR